jgi:transcriptional regulator with XRE-family HTH domain
MTAQELLKDVREQGLTQAEIAERTGVPQGTISKIERGQKDVLSKTYLALKALHDEVVPWEGKERRKRPAKHERSHD